METLTPYQVVVIDFLKINDIVHTNCRAFFIRYVKADKCMVQVNGTILVLSRSKVTAAPDNEI